MENDVKPIVDVMRDALRVAIEMRSAQRLYFKTGLKVDLIESKRLETALGKKVKRDDPHGCKADYLQELIDYTLQQLHEVGECDGANGGCVYCQDDECNSPNSKSE